MQTEQKTTKTSNQAYSGYTFRSRKAINESGCAFLGFLPAPGNLALKSVKQTIERWHFPLKSSWSLNDLAQHVGPIDRGWMSYCRHYRSSAFQGISLHLDRALARWAMRKYKRWLVHSVRAGQWISEMSQRQVELSPLWRRSLSYVAASLEAL